MRERGSIKLVDLAELVVAELLDRKWSESI
jgi:hypothetical protein